MSEFSIEVLSVAQRLEPDAEGNPQFLADLLFFPEVSTFTANPEKARPRQLDVLADLLRHRNPDELARRLGSLEEFDGLEALQGELAASSGNADEAKDLTQQFFQQLLEKQFLDMVHPSKGKFRSFLLATFKNLIRSEWRRAHAQKRGGGQLILSIDEQDPEGRYKCEPAETETPDQLYEKRWAQTLVGRAINRLKEEWEAQDKPFDKLKVYLLGAKGTKPFAEMAEELGTTEVALKAAVHRMRKRYGELFRSEVALTVGDASEVDDELKHLLGALGS